MRLLCRFGIHKWGKWSNRWYKKYTVWDPFGFDWDEYTIQRTLKCSECDHEKNKHIETLTGIGSTLQGKVQPTWS